MTAIAYRDGIMAGDTMTLPDDDNVKVLNDRKVSKRRGHLFGLSGDSCPSNAEFMAYFFSKRRGQPFGVKDAYSFKALVVTPDGSIQLWDQDGISVTLDETFWAVGSGKEFAIGAMEEGASARRAVAVAIKRCPTVSGKVVSRSLHGRSKESK